MVGQAESRGFEWQLLAQPGGEGAGRVDLHSGAPHDPWCYLWHSLCAHLYGSLHSCLDQSDSHFCSCCCFPVYHRQVAHYYLFLCCCCCCHHYHPSIGCAHYFPLGNLFHLERYPPFPKKSRELLTIWRSLGLICWLASRRTSTRSFACFMFPAVKKV